MRKWIFRKKKKKLESSTAEKPTKMTHLTTQVRTAARSYLGSISLMETTSLGKRVNNKSSDLLIMISASITKNRFCNSS